MDSQPNQLSLTQIPQNSGVETAQQLQSAQMVLRMKNTAKKLLGNKKASKLFRLGLQQLVMAQPEYFLMASKRLIGLGQYRKAFALLQKQLPHIDSLRAEFQPIIMHHSLHICHKLLCKYIRNQEHALESEQNSDHRERAAAAAAAAAVAAAVNSAAGSAGGAKKKTTFSLIERINALISIQTQNLEATQTILLNLNQQSKAKQNSATNAQTQKLSNAAAATAAQSAFAQLNNQSNVNHLNEDDDLDVVPPSSIEDWKIEVFSESFLFYFFSTIKIGFKHFRQEGLTKAALSLLQKGTKFIEDSVDGMFGDFKGMDVYRLAGDLLMMKANVYFEAQNMTEARSYYEKAFKYFHFSGQLALKRMQSTNSNSGNSGLELKVENTFSSLSLNIALIAVCYDHQLNFERTLEALHTSDWINSKILSYDYTSKLRTYVTDHLKEAEAKYRVFLEEKGEIRRVLLKGFPQLEALEAKASEKVDPNVEMINKFNSYLYDKADTAQLNKTLVLLHGHRGGAGANGSEHVESARESEFQSQDAAFVQIRQSGDNNTNTLTNFDQVVTVLVNGREQQQHPQSAGQQRRIASSPSYPHLSHEKVKENGNTTGAGTGSIDRDTQSFSDYFNIHADNSQTKDSTFYNNNNNNNNSTQHNHSLSKTLLSSPSMNFFSPNSSLYPPSNHAAIPSNNNNNHNISHNHSHSQSNSSNNNNNNNNNNLVSTSAFLPHQHHHNFHKQPQNLNRDQSEFIKVQHTQVSGDLTHSIANSPTHTTFRSFATPTAHQQSLSHLHHSGNNNNNHHHQSDNQSKNTKKFSLGNLHAPLTISQSAMRQSNHNSERVQSAMYSSSSKSMMNNTNNNNNNNGVGGASAGSNQGLAPIHKLANVKPKVLTTNKYFQPDLVPISSQPPPENYREVTASCPSQEQKYHYLNLQPTKPKKDKKQGVISLDYAMENLIKEKIIQSDLSLMQAQHQVLDHLQLQQANVLAAQSRSNLLQQQQSMILFEDGAASTTLQSQSFAAQNSSKQQQQQSQASKIASFAQDKHIGEQIRNLMNSLNIPAQNQREIIDDMAAKFESEKRPLQLASKSKMSQQGWTTEKIINELMRSINILGENVNTYNQRFAQFLSTIKEEDFDRSEFHTCLRKLIFRKRMGNGVIPSFFSERQQPIAIIQEMLKIDNEYVVIQSGGERMNELMSDHKIIKNYFDEVTSPTEPSTSDDLQKKDLDDAMNQNNEGESSNMKHYKQKQKKIQPAKTNAFGESRVLTSSDSNVEKQMMMFGKASANENYFQKSQETLRQMVLQSEIDCEEMQKQIRHPKRSGGQKHNMKARTLGFTSFSKDLASSIMPYTHRLRVQKAAGKIDNSDLLKIQNKWKNSSAKLPSPTSMSFVGTPISNRLSQTSMMNPPATKSSNFAFKEAIS